MIYLTYLKLKVDVLGKLLFTTHQKHEFCKRTLNEQNHANRILNF